jgi:hypothetical protein
MLQTQTGRLAVGCNMILTSVFNGVFHLGFFFFRVDSPCNFADVYVSIDHTVPIFHVVVNRVIK